MKKMLYGKDAKPVLDAMGYNDGLNCCRKCIHYHGPDFSGSSGAQDAHCSLNAVLLPVVETGVCNYFHRDPQ